MLMLTEKSLAFCCDCLLEVRGAHEHHYGHDVPLTEFERTFFRFRRLEAIKARAEMRRGK